MVKLFAHRGFVEGEIAQNSVASFKQAYENNFRAIEFDIWFLQQKLFLKHDLPKKNELKNLANFSDYLVHKNEFFYWMDFKNLDEKNADEALKLAKEQIEKAQINLEQVYFAPFITNYKISEKIFKKIKKIFGSKTNLVTVCQHLKSDEDVEVLREFLTKNFIKNLSIFHQLIDEKFIKIFSDIKIFAWTVNDLKRLKELEKLGVQNFATDKITPKNYESAS